MSSFSMLSKAGRLCLMLAGLTVLLVSGAGAQGLPERMYYKFNSANNNVVVNHAPAATQFGASGTLMGNLSVGGTGQFGAGLQGSASSSSTNYFNTGWNTNLSGSWTISLWLDVPTPPTTRYYFGDNSAGSFRCFTGGVANNGLRLTGPFTINIANIQPGPVVAHFVYDASAGTVSAYKNGVFETSINVSTSLTISSASGIFKIGGYSSSTGLDGSLDEFRMYNRALTAAEIASTWNTELLGYTGPNNASAFAITEPVNFCAGTHDIKLKVKNNGNNVLNNVQINWEVNGVAQTPINYTTPIDTPNSVNGNEAIVTLGSWAFSGTGYDIKAWTSLPNGVADTVNGDDTTQVHLQAALGGVYTIGGSNPDYTTIAAAVSDLNDFGICGPVTFNIRNGTYNGQFALGNVNGTSAVNRITFRAESGNADNVIIQHSSTSSASNYTVRLDGASYITLRDLTIKANGSTYGRVIDMSGGCSYDSLYRLKIVGKPNATSSNKAGIYATGISGGNNVIAEDSIYSGYYGIYYRGSSSSNLTEGNIIEGNTITGVYYYSLYPYYTRDLKVRNNKILVSGSNTHYAAYIGYGDGELEVSGNTIDANTSSTLYGLRIYYCDGTAAAPGRIFNNVINLTSSGTIYGLYSYYSSNQEYYNNTVRGAGSGSSRYIGYFYHTSATYDNIKVHNNIFANYSSGGYAYAVYNPSYVEADYNLIWKNGSGGIYRTTPSASFSNLQDWREATGLDMNSIFHDPGFMSATDLRPNPASPNSWAVNGRGIQAAWNTTDIEGKHRHSTLAPGVPDIGAYEVEPTTLPPLAEANPAAPIAGQDQYFTFGQDTVATIHWPATATVPSTVEVRQYTDSVMPGLFALSPASYMNFHTSIQAAGGSYEAQLRVRYKDPWLGTIASESTMKLLQKRTNNTWLPYNGAASQSNTTFNYLEGSGVNSLGLFTGIDDGVWPTAEFSFEGPAYICPGQSITLQANIGNGYQYQWQMNGANIPGANASSYVATTGGTYRVVVSNPYGASASSDTMSIELKILPYQCYCKSYASGKKNDTSDNSAFQFGLLTVNQGGPHLYNLGSTMMYSDHTGITPVELYADSTYEFLIYHTLYGGNHADARVTMFIDYNHNNQYDIPDERVFTGTATANTFVQTGSITIPHHAITNVLTGLRVIINNNTSPNVPSDEACGPYVSGETEDFVVSMKRVPPAGVGHLEHITSLRVYPNPSEGLVHVGLESDRGIGQLQLVVTSVTGQQVKAETHQGVGRTFSGSVDLGGVAPGVYFLEVRADGERRIERIVIR
jgi:hypothetical protein